MNARVELAIIEESLVNQIIAVLFDVEVRGRGNNR